MNKAIVFRIDAGKKPGFGHLSRCLNLMEEFDTAYLFLFIIRTDDIIDVRNYISCRRMSACHLDIQYINANTDRKEELELVINQVQKQNAFLVVDHYDADVKYQLQLRDKGIKWLQLDSHAKIDFYADFVLHASPAATKELYQPLGKNSEIRWLLGTSYALLSKSFQGAHDFAIPREMLTNILICFGGGDNRGTMIKVLELLDKDQLTGFSIDIIVGKTNEDIDGIHQVINEYSNIELHIDISDIIPFMVKADLAIISPGTISYESACMGLPMLLIPFAENQLMNAKGWVDIGCAISPGRVESISQGYINSIISELHLHPERLFEMSNNCLDAVDGRGAKRSKMAIETVL